MKNFIFLMFLFTTVSAYAQEAKLPSGCKMYLDEAIVAEISKDAAVKWCELSPPEVKCADGVVYRLETFKISFLTLSPFQNQDFGIGQQGFPIRARQAVAGAKSGDTIILKEATYLDANGNSQKLPTLSFKIL